MRRMPFLGAAALAGLSLATACSDQTTIDTGASGTSPSTIRSPTSMASTTTASSEPATVAPSPTDSPSSSAPTTTQGPTSTSVPEQPTPQVQAALKTAATLITNRTNVSVDRATYYQTSRQSWAKAINTQLGDADQDVTVVIAEGSFIDGGASRPVGATSPRGRYAVVVVSRATGEVLDWGVTGALPDPSIVGAPTAAAIPVS